MARSGPRKVQRYSAAFKLKAVKLSSLAGVRIKDVAASLDIHPFMLSKWRKQVRDGVIRARASIPPEVRADRESIEMQAFAKLKREHALLQEAHELLKKSHPVLLQSKQQRFAFIAEQDRLSITRLCRQYGVTRSGYYAYLRREICAHRRRDEQLAIRIRTLFDKSRGTYGSPRIHALLRKEGAKVACKRVARLMREQGLRARVARIYRRMPGTKAFFTAIPQRLPERTTCANQVWLADITFLRLHGRWRFLAVVMDRHSRRVLGWSLSTQRTSQLTLLALKRAITNRRPQPGLIFHTDRGSEFGAYAFRDKLARLGIVQSMNRPGSMNDNAQMESFFHSLKAEELHGRRFQDQEHLSRAIRSYVQRYNQFRIHSSLGYCSPIDYERAAA